MTNSVCDRVDDILRKGENAGYQHFFPFPSVFSKAGKGENAGYQHFPLYFTMFPKAFFYMVIKTQDCVVLG